jgi:hypothetical protein
MRKGILMGAGLSLALSACGGGVDPLAQLCVDEAVKGLEGQVYRLDEKQVAKSKAPGENGTFLYTGDVILKPGTSAESTQSLYCLVEPATAEAPARVIRFRFDMTGSGLTN